MSDSENYFSDSDNDNGDTINTPNNTEENEESDDEDFYELDEETRQILHQHYLKNKDKEDTDTTFFKDVSNSPVPKKKI